MQAPRFAWPAAGRLAVALAVLALAPTDARATHSFAEVIQGVQPKIVKMAPAGEKPED